MIISETKSFVLLKNTYKYNNKIASFWGFLFQGYKQKVM